MRSTAFQRPPTAVVACAEALRGQIVRGELRPGEQLPPERVLAANLGVDRGTLRTALQRLVAAGLIRQRPKEGTVVLDAQLTGGLDLLPTLLRFAAGPALRAHLDDLLLVRRHLAAAVLERLQGQDCDAAGLDAVVAAVDALAAVVDDDNVDKGAFVAHDVAVLRAVVALSGSRVLALALNPVVVVLDAVPALGRAIADHGAASVVAYRAVVDWLRQAPADRVDPAPLLALLRAHDDVTLAAVGAALAETAAVEDLR